MSIIIKSAFFLGVIILSFFSWGRSPVPYEVPKVFFFNLWVGILTLLTSISLFREKKALVQINNSIFLTLIFFVGYSFICSLLGNNFTKSFWGNYYRVDGLITLVNLVLLSFLTALNWRKDWDKSLMLASVVSIIILLIETGLDKTKYPQAITLNFGNPNFLGGYLAVTLPLLFMFLRKNKSKILCALLILGQIIIIFLTKSWASIVIGVIAISGSLFIIIKERTKKFLFSLFIFLAALCILGLYFYKYQEIKKRFIGGYMPEGRGRIYTKAILAIVKKPITGWGWANFDYAFNQVVWPMKYQHDLYVDKAHSLLLEITVATGIPGLFLYLILITLTVEKLIARKNKYFLLVFVLFLLHSQTNILSISEEIYFWVLVGIAGTKQA